MPKKNPSQWLRDPDLPRRLRAGEPSAIEAVVDAYLGQILRAAKGSGLSPQVAEEVAQATFTTFVESLHRFEGRSQVRTWLFGILYHKVSEARRGFERDRRTEDIDAVFESRFDADGAWAKPPELADANLDRREIHNQLGACLGMIPDRQHAAFVLREVEGLSTHEISEALDVTANNVGVLLHRARNGLRECLESKDVLR